MPLDSGSHLVSAERVARAQGEGGMRDAEFTWLAGKGGHGMAVRQKLFDGQFSNAAGGPEDDDFHCGSPFKIALHRVKLTPCK